MVPKKALQRLNHELSVIVSHNKTIKRKIEELDDFGDGSLSAEEKEFKFLVAATDHADSMVKNLKTEEDLESSKKVIKSTVDRMQDLRKCLAEFEDKFQRYNIPKICDSKSLGDYLYKLQEFMKIWKQEVEKGREKGEKSLIEWLKQIGYLLKLLEHKLKKVDCKMNELKMELLSIRDRDDVPKTWNLLKEKLDMGIEEIWKSLDLK